MEDTASARSFDSDLQMFREPAQEPNMLKLQFLRWLAERGLLEHDVFGPPAGEYAEREHAGANLVSPEVEQ